MKPSRLAPDASNTVSCAPSIAYDLTRLIASRNTCSCAMTYFLHAILVVARGENDNESPAWLYRPLKLLHPADPLTVLSVENTMVISVPEITLVTASPEEMLDRVHIVPMSAMGSGVTSRANVNVASPVERLRSPALDLERRHAAEHLEVGGLERHQGRVVARHLRDRERFERQRAIVPRSVRPAVAVARRGTVRLAISEREGDLCAGWHRIHQAAHRCRIEDPHDACQVVRIRAPALRATGTRVRARDEHQGDERERSQGTADHAPGRHRGQSTERFLIGTRAR